jgi:hypothetical protein
MTKAEICFNFGSTTASKMQTCMPRACATEQGTRKTIKTNYKYKQTNRIHGKTNRLQS